MKFGCFYSSIRSSRQNRSVLYLKLGDTYKVSFDARSAVDGRQLRFYFGEEERWFCCHQYYGLQPDHKHGRGTYEVTVEVPKYVWGSYKNLALKIGLLSNADVFSLIMVSMEIAPDMPPNRSDCRCKPDSIEFDLGIGESATSVLEVLNLAGMGADDLEFSIAVENAAARNYSSGVRTQFATVQGADRASGAVIPAGTIDAVVAHNAALMAIDEFSEGFADITTLPGDGWFAAKT